MLQNKINLNSVVELLARDCSELPFWGALHTVNALCLRP